jgi:hypothetical protein
LESLLTNTETNVFNRALSYKQSLGHQWEDAGGTGVTSFNKQQDYCLLRHDPISPSPLPFLKQSANDRPEKHCDYEQEEDRE